MTRRGWYCTGALIAVTMLFVIMPWPSPLPGFAQGLDCPEPNDDLATACHLTGDVTVQAFIDRPGDVDIYRFVVSGGAQVTLDLADLSADYDLYLMDANRGILGQSVHEGTAPERLHLTVQAGTYYAIVQADPARGIDAGQPYSLRLGVTGGSVPPGAAASEPEAGRLLLSETFDDATRSALPRLSSPDGRFELMPIDGEYSVRNTDPDGRGQGTYLPGTYVDALLGVDARLVDGASASNFISIACRHSPTPARAAHDGYWWAIYPQTQQFELNRLDRGRSSALVPRQVSTAIRPGDQWNRLEVICIGSTITMRANGQVLATVHDSTHREGRFLITTGPVSGQPPGSEARLDNLVVYGP